MQDADQLAARPCAAVVLARSPTRSGEKTCSFVLCTTVWSFGVLRLKKRPRDVKAGDRVLFGKWSGTEVKLDGQELLIMKESDIMGVVEGQASSAQKAA